MGRHSAPDDEEDGGVLVAEPGAEPVRPSPRGRHSSPEDEVTAPTPTVAERPVGPVGKGNQSTAADLELLRTRSDVRARVIAAVLAPFVIYGVVMLLIGGLGVLLVWAWLPLVTAGVLAGSILDAAHRKRPKQSSGD